MLTEDQPLIIIPGSQSISYDESLNYKPINYIDYSRKGSELLELLRQVGAVTFDINDKIALSAFFTNNGETGSVSRLLGYLAEALIVRDCNNNSSNNRKWANYARKLKSESVSIWQAFISIFYEPFLENIENYIAIGTGFASTKKGSYSWIYNPISDRDICWIHKDNDGRQLLNVHDFHTKRQRFAGLQVKVSCKNDGSYVTRYFKRKPYYSLYPVVYFDLGNDFEKTKQNIFALKESDVKPNTLFSQDVKWSVSREEVIEKMLIRGKYIAPDLHEELLEYQFLLNKVISGEIELDQLANNQVLDLGKILGIKCNNLNSSSVLLTFSN